MNKVSRSSPLISGRLKIADHHLQRLACIYIRQSSRPQVIHNTESQVNQYQLVERAGALGWSKERIRVIDTDLGLSGRESANRDGFKELVAEVSLGHVGIIFGYEVSRLARNNSDWYHLLDLAAVFSTLIADYDGIYDPRLYNDRLLLGLKGTMSEAELHLLQLRLTEGRMRKVERGEHAQRLPTGLERLSDGRVVKSPDDQVRHAIELVFAKFEELGSCRKVLLYLRGSNLLLPRCQTTGPHINEILWKRPSHASVYAFLTNPAYAGAFAYGRTQLDKTRRKPGRPDTGIVRKPMAEWTHLQQDVYPAYITWEQYMKNQERLRQNATRFQESIKRAQGTARKGQALLQGLVTCGVCGYHMRVRYTASPRYVCTELKHRLGEPMCASLHGPGIDGLVVQAFFEAIQPAQLNALEAVLEEQEAERALLNRQWKEQLKRAQYETHLAERRYNTVDPDNRLVAAELERRWEQKLIRLQEVREEHERFQRSLEAPALTPDLREQFRHISESLPDLWHNGQLSSDQKKDLLRSLIANVILTRKAADVVEVKIVWVSGHYTILHDHPPVYRIHDLSCYDEMVERIHELWQEGHKDEEIAAQLTGEGFRSTRAMHVYPSTVQGIRSEHGWKQPYVEYARVIELEGYLTVSELAQLLGTNRSWVDRRVRLHQIDPGYVIQHPKYSHIRMIRQDPELIERLRNELCSSGVTKEAFS